MPRGVKWLLIINCSVYVVYFFAARAGYDELFADLGLWPRAVITLPAFWQPVTYMFLHSPFGFTHILLNMLMLWMFGADLEREWGTWRFLQYYFLCGVGAAVCVIVVALLSGNLDRFTIGSSGAIYGLLLAFGVLYAERVVLFFFLFPMKAKYFVMICGAIAFLGSFGAAGDGVSHVAHLGGMAFGLAYLKRRKLARSPWRPLENRYQAWKMRRARKKFEIYVRRNEAAQRDRWTH
jgi:membrane associated rhomboid family serine protease